MNKLYIILITLLLLTQAGISRPIVISDTGAIKIDSVATVQKGCTFHKGVFMENKDLIVSWGMTFQDLAKFGNPTVTCTDGTRLTWYSLTMFNGIHVKKMWCTFSKCYKRTAITQRLNTLYLAIDTADIPKLKAYLERFPNQPKELVSENSNYHYSYTIDDCKIFLGFEKFNNGGYVWMQSKEFYR